MRKVSGAFAALLCAIAVLPAHSQGVPTTTPSVVGNVSNEVVPIPRSKPKLAAVVPTPAATPAPAPFTNKPPPQSANQRATGNFADAVAGAIDAPKAANATVVTVHLDRFKTTHNIHDLVFQGIHLGMDATAALPILRTRLAQFCGPTIKEEWQSGDACSSQAKAAGMSNFQLYVNSFIDGRGTANMCTGTGSITSSQPQLGSPDQYTVSITEDPITFRPVIWLLRGRVPSCGKQLDYKEILAQAISIYGPANRRGEDLSDAHCYYWGSTRSYFELCPDVNVTTYTLNDGDLREQSDRSYKNRLGLIAKPALQ